jgi:TPR repeat protein
VKWYRKAADQNFDDAQRCLGDCYERGNGVSKNLVEAHKWYKFAAAQGNEAAKKALSMIVPK